MPTQKKEFFPQFMLKIFSRTPSIRQLNVVRYADRVHIGGKAAALGEISSHGISVPDGFVVPTEMWHERIGGKLIESAANEIIIACNALNGNRFAVRSSAIVEDGNKSAWAGQFRTHLNIERSCIREKIEDCMASAQSKRVQVYGALRGVATHEVPIAVIVQEMIFSEVAGVAFSLDPVSGKNCDVIIEAISGVGVGVVDGTETPDRYVVDKSSRTVTSVVYATDDRRGVLSARHIEDILTPVCLLEAHFACPQDVEWAYADGVCWILQSRPITTL